MVSACAGGMIDHSRDAWSRMSDCYSGPWCSVTLTAGRTFRVRGDRVQVMGQLRDHEGGLAVLVGVYGDDITLGSAHVVSIEQMPEDWCLNLRHGPPRPDRT